LALEILGTDIDNPGGSIILLLSTLLLCKIVFIGLFALIGDDVRLATAKKMEALVK
jgi:hypothetical protein